MKSSEITYKKKDGQVVDRPFPSRTKAKQWLKVHKPKGNINIITVGWVPVKREKK